MGLTSSITGNGPLLTTFRWAV